MKNIPLIDISHANQSKDDELAVAMQLDQACRESGFFSLSGHGIPLAVFTQAYAASQHFFALSNRQKNDCRLATGFTSGIEDYTPYGYSGLLEENAFAYTGAYGKPDDYVEKFSVGPRILDDSAALPFPEVIPALRHALKQYYCACEKLSARIAELLTLALDLPRDFFRLRTARSNDLLRSLHYPQTNDAFLNDQGMGAHTDGTLITLLTHTTPGIEVRARTGEWIRPTVHSIDHFIINLGNLMARWSNDVYQSTPHRVVLGSCARQSLVFFKLANDDALIECFPKFCQDKPARHKPILYKKFSLEKMNALFGRGQHQQREAIAQ